MKTKDSQTETIIHAYLHLNADYIRIIFNSKMLTTISIEW